MELHQLIAWGAFLAFVLAMLALDLFVLHRKPHAINLKEAFVGALVPFLAALAFVGVIYWAYSSGYLQIPARVVGTAKAKHFPSSGGEAALMYLTGYLVELSLSADNVFLFVVLMSFFKVPRELQHRVLFWGVIGALVMRGVMIVAGTALIARFEWLMYLFGLFLLYTGGKFMFGSEGPKDPSQSLVVRLAHKVFPFMHGYDGKKFFSRRNGRVVGTTLLLVLICIEFTDLIFALDSIPAIFGITLDQYIVFTSNVFAILGLRSLYFLLAGIMDRFHLLKYGLAVILAFVGVKMMVPGLGDLVGHFQNKTYEWHINQYLSLGVIIMSLVVSIGASLLFAAREHHANPLDEESTPREPETRPAARAS